MFGFRCLQANKVQKQDICVQTCNRGEQTLLELGECECGQLQKLLTALDVEFGERGTHFLFFSLEKRLALVVRVLQGDDAFVRLKCTRNTVIIAIANTPIAEESPCYRSSANKNE